jgi:hypothetical protein
LAKSLTVMTAPPHRERHIPLERVRVFKDVECRIISRKVFGYWSHWFQGRSHPCYESTCTCSPAMSRLPREWHGVLHVKSYESGKDFFLEITDVCTRLLLDQAPDRENLRGLRVIFQRSKGGDKGRLRCRIDGVAQFDQDLPPEANPMKTLDVIWKKKPPLDPTARKG